MTRIHELVSPLNFHDFRVLWASQVLSEIGDWAARVALAILVERRTGSAALTGLVTTVSLLPWVGLGWIISSVADRFPRRLVMVITDVGRGVLFAALILPMPVWALLATVLVAACLRPPFDSARAAMMPSTVPKETYGDAIALVSVTGEAMLIVGYVGGGVLAALWSPEVGLLVNAGSFVASAFVLLGLRGGRYATAVREEPPGVRAGLRAVFHEPFVRRFVTTYAAVAACAVVGLALAVPYAREELVGHYSATDAENVAAAFAGTLAAAVSVGTILAALMLPKAADDTATMRLSAAVAVVGSLGAILAFALDPKMPLAVLPFGFLGVLFASRIPANKVAGLRIPDHVRASAMGILNSLVAAGLAGGAFFGGVVADQIGVRGACLAFLGVAALVSVYAALAPPREGLAATPEPVTSRRAE